MSIRALALAVSVISIAGCGGESTESDNNSSSSLSSASSQPTSSQASSSVVSSSVASSIDSSSSVSSTPASSVSSSSQSSIASSSSEAASSVSSSVSSDTLSSASSSSEASSAESSSSLSSSSQASSESSIASSNAESSASFSSSEATLTTYPDPSIDPTLVNYNDIAVHDPSVIRAEDGTFYVVGSHLGFAKSTDLVNWQLVASGVDDANPLFNTYETEIAEGIEWTGGHVGSWASDIIRLADGRYYFYYNHCANPASEEGLCNAPHSYLGLAVSDNVEGPYEDQGIFLYSGQTDEQMQGEYNIGGLDSFDARVHPNVIDPTAFFDKDGQLWMSYGSYSGGIFILKMDENTGMPEPDQGYGKHIIGGAHSSIEGSFVIYSPESDYYYMFTSFGGYEAADGYNIRVARSRTPDGPYLDAAGNDVANARGGWDSISPYGTKLMGGFNFASYPGSDAEARGYLAPGHNSAYYDEATGQHYLITHTRFPNRGEGHAIRVHELWVNNDGWLVASPQRYAPIEGENIVDYQDIVGDYQLINHQKDINRTAHQSVDAFLSEDGSISGDVTGLYVLYPEQPERITIALDDGSIFEGVTAWQWDPRINKLVPTFSAMSDQGVSLWGVQLQSKLNDEIITAIVDDLTLPTTFKGSWLNLPTEGARGASISWESDNPVVINTSGEVSRPNVGEGDSTVTLTATIERDGVQTQKVFNVTVEERVTFNRVAEFKFENDLSDSTGHFATGSPTADRANTSGSVDYDIGREGQALLLDGTNGVQLPDGLIDNHEYTVSMWVNPTTITGFSPVFFGGLPDGAGASSQWISLQPQGWDGNTMLWSGSQAWVDASTGELIPAATWTHLAFTVDRGTVTVYIDGEAKYTGANLTDFFSTQTGQFSVGVNFWDTPYQGLVDELNVYDTALSAAEIQTLDIEATNTTELLTSAAEILSLGDISAVQNDFALPTSGPYASSVSWVSSDSSLIQVNGNTAVVTRPELYDTDVTLTATISLNGDTTEKAFVVTLDSLAPPTPVAHYSFDEHLDDERGNFTSGSVTGDRLDNTGGTVAYVSGQSGSAVSLDGASGIALPNDLITGHRYSFGIWLNPTTLSQFTPTFFGASSGDSWISLVPFGPGAGHTMLWSGTAWYDGDTGSQIATNQWTHFAAVVDNGEITIYLNGTQVFNNTGFPDALAEPGNSFGIGVNYWDMPYQGLVDELVIYNEAVGADIITDLATP
ncbi:LamG-like jellyroll fold domain-containing protein [Gilvimarinus xylanilyticus]|uniref:Family 43 glycosylhydrolase n=1 Tax=Gilvimarinus xylanilyticus TaxID=2944139 RepID=A0A9X2HW47_9GAMM|nr:LamG-like jellyroll fold domain-containing protein [Gilvimarinus xylanilyticus]MCP8898104.1 family 43 glycosylhydrolase [Gilvimarinus xylanilyticus]